MSLSESSADLAKYPAPQPTTVPTEPPIPPVDPALFRLRAALKGALDIAGEEHRLDRRTETRVYIFRGKLQLPVKQAYAEIHQRFKPIGFTPMLQRDGQEEMVIALEGVIQNNPLRTRWWLHALLLILTLLTTTVMGAALTGIPPSVTWRALREWDTPVLWPAVRKGLPFSLTLLTILGTHEMGHYIAARLHGVKVTPPFFIPLPISNSLGTMGAVIFIRSPLMNRRALFDVGVSGPLAGLVVAIPLFLIGLTRDATLGDPIFWVEAGITRVSTPPLLAHIAELVVHDVNLDKYIFTNHPMALAAWFGVLLTALNLLPMGQFDGGHVAYALLGKRAWPLAGITAGILVLLGVFGMWFAWLIWAFMGMIMGLRHPPPHDD
ncbi:MAG: site-2 protease family protein, partial [Anaerolineae bacterium]|nr:site-2 protease family protein [Anaerolineae bacterium]